MKYRVRKQANVELAIQLETSNKNSNRRHFLKKTLPKNTFNRKNLSIHIYLKTTPVPSICCDQNSSSFFCVFTTRHFVCTF